MPRPKKAPAEVKGSVVQLRVTDEQRALLQFAADDDGRDLSNWLRRLALKEATRVKDRATKKAK